MSTIRRLILIFCGAFLLAPVSAQDPESVSAELGKESAWTGEGIPLVIKLWSPGPFSGTPSFEVPRLPQTTLLKTGRPVVGSEQVGGRTFFTQIHEFTLFTQQRGKITIPAFRVRFAGRQTFTSDPEPMEGQTDELHFTSKRPPGTEGLGFIIATTEMVVTQTWSPANAKKIQAGDVMQRTITRRANGTTAMLLSPVSTDAPHGVRVYEQDPVVHDSTDRGTPTAERSDTIKYQFEKSGTFTLPELSFVWWNPQKNQLQQQMLPGETVTVQAVTVVVPPSEEHGDPWPPIVSVLVLGLILWFGRKPILKCVTAWNAKRHSPETLATRDVLKACRLNDAPAAYAALTVWKHSLKQGNRGLDCRITGELKHEWSTLSQGLYGTEATHSPWSGQRLAKVFRRASRLHTRSSRVRSRSSQLPKLNPTEGVTI